MHIDHLEVGGLTLACRKAGRSSDPCLVLLHGWPQTGLAWEGVLPELGKDNYALAFDLPAVGDSKGAPHSAEKAVIADIVLKGAEAAGGKSIIVAGYDVGGMIAFACARDHGARIEGAVVMNTVVPGVDPWTKILSDPRIWHFAFHQIPELPETLVAGHERTYFDFFYNVMASDPKRLPDARRDAYAKGYARREALRAGFDWYRTMPKDAEHNAKRVAIETPMLYLRGDAGAAGKVVDEYVAGLKNAGVANLDSGVLPNSGEYAPEEAPGALVEALRRFRRSVTSASR
ncbi:MAG TPA: alpha/beta hydrolase [Steroidobacteraceae bacterium]|nr:alpha/beta hydrolase [Steroidobacteraceae bacterium]